MLNSYYTEKLLGLQEVSIKKVNDTKENYEIFIEQPRKQCVCPVCGKLTDKVHDYRMQRIKELSAFEKPVVLVLRKRRYACSCGKRFAEPNSFLPKYQRMTQRTILALIDRLRDCRSYSSVTREFRLSVPTVIRFFRNVRYSKPVQLPEVLGIDEFKGNSGGEKFHGILTDLGKKQVIDIMKTRYEHDLCDYYFPNATYVIDKYHWIRQAIWAFEAVRKEVQKQFSKQYRIYFKKSRHLLLKHMDKLKPEQRQQVFIMLDISPTLSTAYFLKEQLYAILSENDPDKQKKLFSDWIEEAEESDIPAFAKCANTYRNWFTPITNSCFCPYTNGFTEGCNNRIKVLKRNAYGVRNFSRFRNRILFMFSTKSGAEA